MSNTLQTDRFLMKGGLSMNYLYSILLVILATSMVMTFISESYAMSIVFVSTAFLLGFLEFSAEFKEDQLNELWDDFNEELTRGLEINETVSNINKHEIENLKSQVKDLGGRLDKVSFGKLAQR